MKISGFTFVRNASKLFYPVRASIESILPIVDEFVVALGDCDPDDQTEAEIKAIGSEKIKIINTTWDLKTYTEGTIYARQTDIAREACSGDWLFYLQSDELVHEKYLPIIKKRCEELLSDKEVEGLLFDYKHFWGDFGHYMISRAWYLHEIRIIRNDKDIHSWRDAQSFRRIPHFNGKDYNAKEGTEKLKVARVDACVHHYGFVRPPRLMQKKSRNKASHYHGTEEVNRRFKGSSDIFYYGNPKVLHVYRETQPAVMKDWIQKFDWADQLYPNYKPEKYKLNKHEKLKYRLFTFVEQEILGGRQLGGFKNYKLIKR